MSPDRPAQGRAAHLEPVERGGLVQRRVGEDDVLERHEPGRTQSGDEAVPDPVVVADGIEIGQRRERPGWASPDGAQDDGGRVDGGSAVCGTGGGVRDGEGAGAVVIVAGQAPGKNREADGVSGEGVVHVAGVDAVADAGGEGCGAGVAFALRWSWRLQLSVGPAAWRCREEECLSFGAVLSLRHGAASVIMENALQRA